MANSERAHDHPLLHLAKGENSRAVLAGAGVALPPVDQLWVLDRARHHFLAKRNRVPNQPRHPQLQFPILFVHLPVFAAVDDPNAGRDVHGVQRLLLGGLHADGYGQIQAVDGDNNLESRVAV